MYTVLFHYLWNPNYTFEVIGHGVSSVVKFYKKIIWFFFFFFKPREYKYLWDVRSKSRDSRF